MVMHHCEGGDLYRFVQAKRSVCPCAGYLSEELTRLCCSELLQETLAAPVQNTRA